MTHTRPPARSSRRRAATLRLSLASFLLLGAFTLTGCGGEADASWTPPEDRLDRLGVTLAWTSPHPRSGARIEWNLELGRDERFVYRWREAGQAAWWGEVTGTLRPLRRRSLDWYLEVDEVEASRMLPGEATERLVGFRDSFPWPEKNALHGRDVPVWLVTLLDPDRGRFTPILRVVPDPRPADPGAPARSYVATAAVYAPLLEAIFLEEVSHAFDDAPEAADLALRLSVSAAVRRWADALEHELTLDADGRCTWNVNRTRGPAWNDDRYMVEHPAPDVPHRYRGTWKREGTDRIVCRFDTCNGAALRDPLPVDFAEVGDSLVPPKALRDLVMPLEEPPLQLLR